MMQRFYSLFSLSVLLSTVLFSRETLGQAANVSCTFTTNKAGNFTDPTIYTLSGAGGCTGTATRAPQSGDNIVINHAVVLNTNFTIGGANTLTIGSSGSLRQDGTNRTLTVSGSSSSTQNCMLSAVPNGTTRSNARMKVAVLDLARTTMMVGSSSAIEVTCTVFQRNQSIINLASNSLLNVLGNIDVGTGNPDIFGPTAAGATPAGLRVQGNLVNNSGGGAKLFTTTGLITCVQRNDLPSDCGNPSSTAQTTPPTSNDPTCFAVLPVTLTSFSASRQSQNVFLNWATATELNNAYFEVQRSIDGKTFLPIGQVTGNGTTATGATYSFTDRNPLGATSYYRLRQVDNDETESYSSVAAVSGTNKMEASFYPNPTNSLVTLPAVSGLVKYRVYTATGQSIVTGEVQGGAEVSLQQVPAGIYFLELITADKRNVQRFAKQ